MRSVTVNLHLVNRSQGQLHFQNRQRLHVCALKSSKSMSAKYGEKQCGSA